MQLKSATLLSLAIAAAIAGPAQAADDLSNLINLVTIDLWANQLSGPVPTWLNNLLALQYLGLGYNQFSGPIPDLSSLGNLDSLNGHLDSANQDVTREDSNVLLWVLGELLESLESLEVPAGLGHGAAAVNGVNNVSNHVD